jgi:O-antigen chain-terminating methyltransferase
MDENTLRIPEDQINVNEIMQKIRENIRHRSAAGELPPDPDLLSATFPSSGASLNLIGTPQHDLLYITSKWDIHNDSYLISSHHTYIGKMLVKGRQLVHGEVRRYVDPMISLQSEFNASTARILIQTSHKCTELEQKISHWEGELSQKIYQHDEELSQKIYQHDEELSQKIYQHDEELSQKIYQHDEELSQKISHQELELNSLIQNCVNSNFREVFAHVDKDLLLRLGLAHILEERIQREVAQKSTLPETTPGRETNYFLFEERFRGSRKDIKQRQVEFLHYFVNCSRVLDIGCGRGEFLEILKDHNIGGIGVDLDPDMVGYCRSQQFDVVQSDAITFLEKLEDKSLDGIFIDQVVEHLEPEYLIRLLVLCYQKLKFGYYLVVETVNPLSFASFVNFYIDLTHKRPVHPETLQFLVHATGFRECKKKFFSPVSEENRLKKISNVSSLDETAQKNIEVYNNNIEILNTVLFGAQDYAVIGKK